jgi:hypothetical protein
MIVAKSMQIVKLLRMRIVQTNGLQRDFYGRRLCFTNCGLVKITEMYRRVNIIKRKRMDCSLQGYVDNIESSAKRGTEEV